MPTKDKKNPQASGNTDYKSPVSKSGSSSSSKVSSTLDFSTIPSPIFSRTLRSPSPTPESKLDEVNDLTDALSFIQICHQIDEVVDCNAMDIAEYLKNDINRFSGEDKKNRADSIIKELLGLQDKADDDMVSLTVDEIIREILEHANKNIVLLINSNSIHIKKIPLNQAKILPEVLGENDLSKLIGRFKELKFDSEFEESRNSAAPSPAPKR